MTERPLVRLDSGALDEHVAASWAAVRRTNTTPELFQAGGRALRVDRDVDDGAPIVQSVTPTILVEYLSRHARYERWVPTPKKKPRGWMPVDPPERLASTMLSWVGERLLLPPLERIVECPQVLQDGTVVITAGYSTAGRFLYLPARALTLPDAPATVPGAREFLHDVLDDFPRATDSDFAYAAGVMLALIGRDVIAGQVPFHLIDKPAPGTGAGLLADALLWPALGRQAGRLTQAKGEEEMRKRLTAKLLTRPAAVFLDNLSGRLDGEAFASILTTGAWEDRRLGVSELVTIPARAVWIGTANNLAVASDLARRFVTIRLDAKVGNPHLRPPSKFRHPRLLPWLQQQRGALIRALLTLWQAWFTAGAPRPESPTLGSFEEWAQVIGAVLQVAEIPGFLADRASTEAAISPDETAWAAFVQAWWDTFKDRTVTVAELWPLVTPEDKTQDGFDLGLGDASERALKQRVGKRLHSARDRFFGPYRIVLAGRTASNSSGYQLVPPADPGGSQEDPGVVPW
jgi:putative DNA primase/helicase